MSRHLGLAGIALIVAGLVCWLTGLDDALHDLFRLPAASPLRLPVLRLTFLGGLVVMGPFALIVVLALLIRGERRRAGWLFGAIVSGRLAVEGLKALVMRPRPPQAERLDTVASWSFPSSHSAGTMLTLFAIALLVGRPGAFATAVGFALLIGWSRLALGVHWPGDVLAGWGFALLWLAGAVRLLPRPAGTAR